MARRKDGKRIGRRKKICSVVVINEKGERWKCPDSAESGARGLCNAHYQQQRKGKPFSKQTTYCGEFTCKEKLRHDGGCVGYRYCDKHGQCPIIVDVMGVDWRCKESRKREDGGQNGFCSAHNEQQRDGKPFVKPKKYCQWKDCDSTNIVTLGCCDDHYLLMAETIVEKIQRIDGMDECWITSLKRVAINGELKGLPQLAFFLKEGRLPKEGLQGNHLCENGKDKVHYRCINPNHITEGTQAENAADTARSGANRKFDEEQQHEIHKEFDRLWKPNGKKSHTGKTTIIESMAKKRGVNRRTIRSVLQGANGAYEDVAKSYPKHAQQLYKNNTRRKSTFEEMRARKYERRYLNTYNKRKCLVRKDYTDEENKNRRTRPNIHHEGKLHGMHHVALWIKLGHKPEHGALHLCGVNCCIEPSHLMDGTSKLNGKHVTMHESQKGRNNANSKLTEEQVASILYFYYFLCWKPKRLAAKFKVTKITIYYIVAGMSWNHVFKQFLEDDELTEEQCAAHRRSKISTCTQPPIDQWLKTQKF